MTLFLHSRVLDIINSDQSNHFISQNEIAQCWDYAAQSGQNVHLSYQYDVAVLIHTPQNLLKQFQIQLNETQHNLMFPDSENNCDSEFI